MIVCLMTGRVHGGGLAEGLLHAWVCLESLRRCYEQSLIDTGQHPGVTREEHEEIKRLKRENAELRRANEILKLASAFFTKELDQPGMR
ncbi:transposase [Mobiluncus mulieris]|nr:transposase [Mobiluncus mulieris]